jgi:excisionase family DNA binding protein
MAALPDPHEKPTLSVPEAADILGVHPRTIYNAVEADTCPAIHMGRIIRIPTAQFLEHYRLERSVPAA